jgi:tRNA A58 N-methylase Trm61
MCFDLPDPTWDQQQVSTTLMHTTGFGCFIFFIEHIQSYHEVLQISSDDLFSSVCKG